MSHVTYPLAKRLQEARMTFDELSFMTRIAPDHHPAQPGHDRRVSKRFGEACGTGNRPTWYRDRDQQRCSGEQPQRIPGHWRPD